MKRHVALNDSGHRIGESHPRAKLTDHEVDLLVQLREEGMGVNELAEKFEVHRTHVWRIFTGRKRAQLATRFKTIETA